MTSKRAGPYSPALSAQDETDSSLDGKFDPARRQPVDETDDEKIRNEAAQLARKAMWICLPATLICGELCSIWPAITYRDIEPVWFFRIFIITAVGWAVLLLIQAILVRMLYKADQANRLWFVRRCAWIFGGWLFGYLSGSFATVIGLNFAGKLEGNGSYGLAWTLLWVQLILGAGPCIAAFVVYVIYVRRIQAHEKRIQARENKHGKVRRAIRSSSKKVKRKLSSSRSSIKNNGYGAVPPSDSEEEGSARSDEKQLKQPKSDKKKKNPTSYTSAAEDSLSSTDEDGQHPNGVTPDQYSEAGGYGDEESYGRADGPGKAGTSKGQSGQQTYTSDVYGADADGYGDAGGTYHDGNGYDDDYSQQAKQPVSSAVGAYSDYRVRRTTSPSSSRRSRSDYPSTNSFQNRPLSRSASSANPPYPSSGQDRSAGRQLASSRHDNRRDPSYASSASRQSPSSTYRPGSSTIPVEVVKVNRSGQPVSVSSREYDPRRGYVPAISAVSGSYPPSIPRGTPYPASSSPYPPFSTTSPYAVPSSYPSQSSYPGAPNYYSSPAPLPSSPQGGYKAYSPPPSTFRSGRY
ncbi:hypothetical protein JCM11251_004027 [Rhodosporidiobolus azoricus]